MSRIVVAHPNVQHSHQLAVALQNADLLERYITRFYVSKHHFPLSWLRWLPSKIPETIEKSLEFRTRRSHPALNPQLVHTTDTGRLLWLIALRRLRLLSAKEWHERVRASSLHFQYVVADYVSRHQTSAVVCYDRFAYETFKSLQDRTTRLVLDMSTAHPGTMRRVLGEEIRLLPAYRKSLEIAGAIGRYEPTEEEAMMADYILAGSKFVADSCVENGIPISKIRIVPYGTDMGRLKPARPRGQKDTFRVLFAGQIGQRKGIHYLLSAWKELSLPKAELWLCGSMMDVCEAIAPFEGTYRYLGYVPHERMADIYSQIDALVLPTLLEGLSQVCLEAMARGRTVVTTPNSGLEGILRDGKDGFIVPIRDVPALSEKIEFLYRNRETCVDMGLSARQTVEEYTWERYHDNIAASFTEILAADD
jgi:glycosyltransferase involved in cell wall biosynthesis